MLYNVSKYITIHVYIYIYIYILFIVISNIHYNIRNFPTKSEIMKKLKKAKNTLIIGIPACWKTSKTIIIHKKGRTDLPSNFRPISLLPTMYKIYSGILSNRIIKVAVSNEWISSQQQSFYPE